MQSNECSVCLGTISFFAIYLLYSLCEWGILPWTEATFLYKYQGVPSHFLPSQMHAFLHYSSTPLACTLLLPDLFRTQQARIIHLCIIRCQALCPGTLQHSSTCLHTSQKVYLGICKVMISITFSGFIYFSCFYGNCTGYGNEP